MSQTDDHGRRLCSPLREKREGGEIFQSVLLMRSDVRGVCACVRLLVFITQLTAAREARVEGDWNSSGQQRFGQQSEQESFQRCNGNLRFIYRDGGRTIGIGV